VAIDTKDKRSSVLGWGLPQGGPLPTPDSTIDAAARRDVGGLYSGISILMNWTTRASMLGLVLGLRPKGPYPDGTLDADDRQMIAGLYHNIHAASPSGTVIVLSRSTSRAIGRALGRSL